ncbi:MAG: hypothetical protein A3E88_05535 [Legionellales bacterium RIFCSPHIGHO2_12_FULL_35_11]|nr:MAG: hypothetical protein A3E88_05535 [Legionellales bacterium RIFCSPHIGHO2_12_FULL_35_11]
MGPDENITEKLLSEIGQYNVNEVNKIKDVKDVKDVIEAIKSKFYGEKGQDNVKTARTDFITSLFAKKNEHKPLSLRIQDRNELIKDNQAIKATVSMENLFGENGLKLFQSALEEERYSTQYMDAVINASISADKTGKLENRLIIPFGGPSASGKSFAKDSLVEHAINSVGKEEDESSRIIVAFIDGGIGREVSQIRRFVILYALSLGYTGISNLEKYTDGYLKSVKQDLFAAVKDNEKINLVIPETFAKLGLPGSTDKLNIADMINDHVKSKKTTVMYARVTDSDREATKHGGEARSWLTDTEFTVKQVDLTLNPKKIPECKAYKAGGKFGETVNFDYGEKNSITVGKKFLSSVLNLVRNAANAEDAAIFNKQVIFTCVNDLRLYKKDSETHDWKRVLNNSQGTIRVSKRVYEDWEKSGKSLPLDKFNNNWKGKKVLILGQSQSLARTADDRQSKFLRNIIEMKTVPGIEKIKKYYSNVHEGTGKESDQIKESFPDFAKVDDFNPFEIDKLDENPLWMVLKAMIPVSGKFSAEAKINAYAKIAEAVIDRRIGEKDKFKVIYNIQMNAWEVAQTNLDAFNRYKKIFGPDSMFNEYVAEKIKSHNTSWNKNIHLLTMDELNKAENNLNQTMAPSNNQINVNQTEPNSSADNSNETYEVAEAQTLNKNNVTSKDSVTENDISSSESQNEQEMSLKDMLPLKDILKKFEKAFEKTNSYGIKCMIKEMKRLTEEQGNEDDKFEEISRYMHNFVTFKNRVNDPWYKNKKFGFFGKGRAENVQLLYEQMSKKNFSLKELNLTILDNKPAEQDNTKKSSLT